MLGVGLGDDAISLGVATGDDDVEACGLSLGLLLEVGELGLELQLLTLATIPKTRKGKRYFLFIVLLLVSLPINFSVLVTIQHKFAFFIESELALMLGVFDAGARCKIPESLSLSDRRNYVSGLLYVKSYCSTCLLKLYFMLVIRYLHSQEFTFNYLC
jgi:hypothetical protein